MTLRSLLVVGCAAVIASSCATPIGVRFVDRGKVRQTLSTNAVSSDAPSAFSRQVMLRLALADRFRTRPEETLAKLHDLTMAELNRDRLFALAEFSFLHAEKLERICRHKKRGKGVDIRRGPVPPKPECRRAQAYYVAASMYAYAYLFPEVGALPPDPLDPHLRTAADLYNLAVTAAVVRRDGTIHFRDVSYRFHLGVLELDLDESGLFYADRRLENFVAAAQLEVRGLRNRYRSPGLGAPFVAQPVHVPGHSIDLSNARVSESVRVPVTILLRYDAPIQGLRTGAMTGRIEIYTENDESEIEIDGKRVALEYETSSALAYGLEHSQLWDFEIAGFLSGELLPVPGGLVMMTPYRPGKIPLVLVHGTASSPARWAEMLNELMTDERIRSRYQFWIFMYSTGNPILYSGNRLRQALLDTLSEIDPEGQDEALQQMVVAGHSQGGLLTKLLVIQSGTRFWDAVTDRPFDSVDLHDDTRELLEQAMFVEPLPFVKRVIFISTPHRGSFLAGRPLGRLASRLFKAPSSLLGLSVDLARSGVVMAGSAAKLAGPGVGSALARRRSERPTVGRVTSSVENMAPGHPFIETVQRIPVAASVHAHSIIPVHGDPPPEGQNDGVVEYESASITEAESEYVVYQSEHSTQSNPETIQEVRRILLEHVGER